MTQSADYVRDHGDMTTWLDEYHPAQYEVEGERYNRCPTCEEWSPCRVRMMAEALRRIRDEAVDAYAVADEVLRLIDGVDRG